MELVTNKESEAKTMIVAMQGQATEENIQQVIERMVELGFNVHRTTGAAQTILAGVGRADQFGGAGFKVVGGEADPCRVSSPFKRRAPRFRAQGAAGTF